MPANSAPFRPLAIRIVDKNEQVSDSVRSVDPIRIAIDYELTEDVTGLRVGYYLFTTRGEPVFTSFDTDAEEMFREYTARKAGVYTSRCLIPADTLNEGRFVLGDQCQLLRHPALFPGRPGAKLLGGRLWRAGNALARIPPWRGETRFAVDDRRTRWRVSNLIKKTFGGEDPRHYGIILAAEGGKNKPWAAHYRLEGLQDVFTDAVAEVEALRKQADKPKRSVFSRPCITGWNNPCWWLSD